MDSYDNDWIFMLDDDLFEAEDERRVDKIQSKSERFACGRLYCPFDLRGDGTELEHGSQSAV